MDNIKNFDFKSFEFDNLHSIKNVEKVLLNAKINNNNDLKLWLKTKDRITAKINEGAAWLYINMSRDTENKEKQEKYVTFATEVEPLISDVGNKLNQKFIADYKNYPFETPGIELWVKSIENELAIFRTENLPLFSEEKVLAQKYGQLSGGLKIKHNGQELTMQQAGKLLQSPDRNLRKVIFEKVIATRTAQADVCNQILSDLIKLRTRIAKNAGFDNYRDYMFVAMNRFDYSVTDCEDFHNSVEKFWVPINQMILERRKNKMNIDTLKPYDLSHEPEGKAPLKAFETATELLNKTKSAFTTIDPEFGQVITNMEQLGHFDLESRPGKAPGGYNYPLDSTGLPFIFMNAAGTFRDVITLLHEGGHALHSYYVNNLEYIFFKHPPSEVAELASMGMELISQDQWKYYFNEEDKKRALKEHLEDIANTLPWVATVDAYQHWLYTNPNHTATQRNQKWVELSNRFSPDAVNWAGYEHYREVAWQKQLHIFEVPFYYIEYGFAQMGAVQLYRNYAQDASKTVSQYKDFLKKGYTEPIGSLYHTAGVAFDFSENQVSELASFIQNLLQDL